MTTIDTGAEPGSPTGTEGVESAAAPTAHEPSDDLSADGLRKALERSAKDEAPPKKPAKASAKGDKKTADPVASPDDKADPKAKGDTEETVPKSAFLARLGKETEKRRAAEEKLASVSNEVSRYRAALEIANEEIQRLQQARKEGLAFDERDELIREHEVSAKARAEMERLKREHQEALARARQEAEFEAYRDQLAEEIERAVSEHDLVPREAVIAAMRANPELSAKQAAEQAEARILERARLRQGVNTASPNPFPKTAGKSASGTAVRNYSLDKDGIEARLRDLSAQNN